MTRRRVLAGMLLGLIGTASIVLGAVTGTVLLAATTAVVVFPVHRALRMAGVRPWIAAATTTIGVYLAALAATIPVAAFLFLRLDRAFAILADLPGTVSIDLLGTPVTIDLAGQLAGTETMLTRAAVRFAAGVPALAVKVVLFGVVLFGLLYGWRELRLALVDPVPARYHDIVAAYARRARETLNGIYVLQGATAIATTAIAVPVFWSLGYRSPIALAVIAGLLQFLPIVGPSLLIGGLGIAHLAADEWTRAAAILIVGIGAIAWFPDLIVRTRLAPATAQLPATLYFVGFVGGLLSLGAIGIVVGPLLVALLVETVLLLGASGPGSQSTLDRFGSGR